MHWYSRVRVSTDNGKCERFNRTIQEEIHMSPQYMWYSDIRAL
jgi:transposase InsO family protein